MNFVTYAIPLFIIAIAAEALYGWNAGRNTYRLDDTLNSLQLGVLSRLRGVVQLGLIGISFEAASGGWTLLQLDAGNPLLWVFAFVAYDLCYYFSHRYGHEWRILWASHVVHHSSEEFNLSTALRQTSTGWLNGIFYLPLYALGIPVELMISVGSLNLIYQFWVHTEHVGKLGWLEWIFVTPSNHRVHHAKNPDYIDRNYGGVFIIWDRLFGTFKEESPHEPCRYGITNQLNSWNPVWANLHAWHEGVLHTWQTPRLRDKVRLWFKSPAWQPPGVASPSHDWQADKFAPVASGYAQVWCFIQFWLHTGSAFVLLGAADGLTAASTLLLALWISAGFVTQGMLLESRAGAATWELLRTLAGALLLITLPALAPITHYGLLAMAVLAVTLIPLLRTDRSAGHLQSPG